MHIELPPIESDLKAKSLLYGIDSVIKTYIGSKLTPTKIHGEWAHGVVYDYLHFHPYAIIGGNGLNPGRPTWVPRKKDETYLTSMGFAAKAIGAPICYLPELSKNYERAPKSLLVMPAHSSHFIASYDKNNTKFITSYVDYISSIACHFDKIFVCLHSECIKRGLWIDDFRSIGLEVIQGASTSDLNSLERVRALMSQFEYVTSNVLGSHIAYAAAYGAKASIAGPYHSWHRESFLKEPFYAANQNLLDILLNDEEIAKGAYPFLFVSPKDAMLNIDWGKSLIGIENRLSPIDLAKLLKIGFVNEVANRANTKIRNLLRPIVNLVRAPCVDV
jgi:hypothetical protein